MFSFTLLTMSALFFIGKWSSNQEALFQQKGGVSQDLMELLFAVFFRRYLLGTEDRVFLRRGPLSLQDAYVAINCGEL